MQTMSSLQHRNGTLSTLVRHSRTKVERLCSLPSAEWAAPQVADAPVHAATPLQRTPIGISVQTVLTLVKMQQEASLAAVPIFS